MRWRILPWSSPRLVLPLAVIVLWSLFLPQVQCYSIRKVSTTLKPMLGETVTFVLNFHRTGAFFDWNNQIIGPISSFKICGDLNHSRLVSFSDNSQQSVRSD